MPIAYGILASYPFVASGIFCIFPAKIITILNKNGLKNIPIVNVILPCLAHIFAYIAICSFYIALSIMYISLKITAFMYLASILPMFIAIIITILLTIILHQLSFFNEISKALNTPIFNWCTN